MSTLIGKAGTNMRKHCGCKATVRNTVRGKRYFVTCDGSKMMRLVSAEDAARINRSGEVCAFLPIPFVRGGRRRRG